MVIRKRKSNQILIKMIKSTLPIIWTKKINLSSHSCLKTRFCERTKTLKMFITLCNSFSYVQLLPIYLSFEICIFTKVKNSKSPKSVLS
jgi:hypothetical protein